MKALSVRNPYAGLIRARGGLDVRLPLSSPASGAIRHKRIELRSKPTKYRGDLLICASGRPDTRPNSALYETDAPDGHALTVVRLANCRKATLADSRDACFDLSTLTAAELDKLYAWELEDPRDVEPFPVKGKLSFFDVEMP